MPEVLVINLPDSVDRMARFTAHCEAVSLEFSRIDALDARAIPADEFDNYDAAAARKFLGRDVFSGEIGCFVSHMRAADRIANSDAEYGLVLEDDAIPPHGLLDLAAQTVAALDEYDPNWSLVNLGQRPDGVVADVADIRVNGDSYKLQRSYRYPLVTVGLLWSRQGAQRFLSRGQSIWAPVDLMIRSWLSEQGGGYAFASCPVGRPEEGSEDWDSDIEFGADGNSIMPTPINGQNRKRRFWEHRRNGFLDHWNALNHRFNLPFRTHRFD